jgi:ribosome-binding protein aMBF1 (putative translation factor)
MKCELCDNKAEAVYITPEASSGINICNHCAKESSDNWVSYPIA